MKTASMNDFKTPHFDFDHLRPIAQKDLQPFDPAERSYLQAHHYAVTLQTNRLI
ncbi:hypothetical protein ACFP1H_07340 [Secundilactobacillus hailunensis]|uniref:Uncharacterized protein n=1 Tax=Secundilactobacillus hailunensis TaxID=2559923 RepID=A0ABW1T8L2_9LACO|nr:hypothetical protein [Secundilactobacillus hailunensis]